MTLKVIALVSGGKDSIYTIAHCEAHDHQVVALANLHPRVVEDDINSYMYQTVGHDIIPLFEKAIDIPLYRQEISGSAVNTDRDYAVPKEGGGSEKDETEDLIPLLKKVMKECPHANAICTGAILSTYQRTRVESVAVRLNLIPLSYLWQYPILPPYSQSALLRHMGEVGFDARIIKVASGGLDDDFLGKNVADPKTISKLQKAMGRFGSSDNGAVLGEGGEYETLAVDEQGGLRLFKKQIKFERWKVIKGEGGNSIAKGEAKLVNKETKGEGRPTPLVKPDLWDDEFKEAFTELMALGLGKLHLQDLREDSTSIMGPRKPSKNCRRPNNRTNWTSDTTSIANFQSTVLSNPFNPSDTTSLQMETILRELQAKLTLTGSTPASILHTTILLRDMADFTVVNRIYSSIFTTPNPPSRVTIACGTAMPPGCQVMLSAIASIKDSKLRKGLHVQSRSYWAPANIGPYSQAVSIPASLPRAHSPPGVSDQLTTWRPRKTVQVSHETKKAAVDVIYIAGQIPLVPATMELYSSNGFLGEALLALQHLFRIGRAMNVASFSWGVAYISDCEIQQADHRARAAREAWRCIHEQSVREQREVELGTEDEEIDLWDSRNHGGLTHKKFEDKTYRSPIPDSQVFSGHLVTPPCFTVLVSALPRDVNIEWSSVGISRPGGEPQSSTPTPIFRSQNVSECPLIYTLNIGSGNERSVFIAAELPYPTNGEDGAEAKAPEDKMIRSLITYLHTLSSNPEERIWEHATLYASSEVSGDIFEALNEDVGVAQWVPCYEVWGADGGAVAGVLVGRVTIMTVT